MERRTLRRRILFGRWFVPILVLIFLGIGVALLIGEVVSITPRSLTLAPGEPSPFAPYALSPEQRDLVARLGYPDAFTILFYREEQPGAGQQEVRLEVWTYHRAGLEISLLNGQVIEQSELQPFTGVLPAMPYRPEQFGPGMDPEAVLRAAGLKAYIRAPLDMTDMEIEGGTLLFGPQIVFGFQDEDFRYVESFALEGEVPQ